MPRIYFIRLCEVCTYYAAHVLSHVGHGHFGIF